MTEIYVDQDGQYNWHNEVIIFDRDSFTERQWEIFTELDGPERFTYAQAVTSEDAVEISRLEESYGYDPENGEY